MTFTGAASFVGKTLQETYRIERQVGAGGMGAVFEAAHMRLPKRFAVKVLHPRAALDAVAVARFQREAFVASGVGHPHIIEVIDFNHLEDGTPYIVMELLRGEDLRQRIKRLCRLPLLEAISIARQITSALAAAHRMDVVHRDLKPSNVFLATREKHDCYVKVLDFGISKVRSAGGGITRVGDTLGTPVYMAPEQAAGLAREVSPQTDLFALGTMLFEMLSGELPFQARDGVEAMQQIQHATPRPLAGLCPGLPQPLLRLVRRLLAKQPADRPPSAADVTERLERLLASASNEALRVTPTEDHLLGGVRHPGPDGADETFPPPAAGAGTWAPPPAEERTAETASYWLGAPAAPAVSHAPAAPASPAPRRPRSSWRRIAVVAALVFIVIGALAGVLMRAWIGARPRTGAARVADANVTLARAAVDSSAAPGDAAEDAPLGDGGDADRSGSMPVVRLRPQRSASLRLSTTSGGDILWAAASVDGKPRGNTPLRLKLRAGRHLLRISRPGYRTRTLELSLRYGETRRLTVALQRE